MQNETLTHLSELMSREVYILREMLSNMQQEQEAILNNNTDLLKQVTYERELMIDSMFKLREKKFEQIEDATIFEDPELSSFKDQIIAILDKLKRQGLRNSYLLENKVAFTKNMIYRLHPDESKQLYQGDGNYGKKVKTTTITLVNHEV